MVPGLFLFAPRVEVRRLGAPVLMTDWKRVRFVGYISVPADIVYQQMDN